MMITLRDLTIGYAARHNEKVVATGINAEIRRGELTCLIGENGAGKSTLLRTLAAFQPHLGGSIEIEGRNIDDYTPQQMARTIGVVLTERPTVQQMTAGELVALGRAPHTGFWGGLDDNDRRIVSEALHLVGIEALRPRLANTLSDGELQKTMIAKALAQQTPIILLDEPTAFLDYPSKVEMLLLLRRLCREEGKTVFLSTHDLELALRLSDTLWLMRRGQPLCTGTPQALADNGTISSFVDRNGIAFDTSTMSIKTRI